MQADEWVVGVVCPAVTGVSASSRSSLLDASLSCDLVDGWSTCVEEPTPWLAECRSDEESIGVAESGRLIAWCNVLCCVLFFGPVFALQCTRRYFWGGLGLM